MLMGSDSRTQIVAEFTSELSHFSRLFYKHKENRQLVLSQYCAQSTQPTAWLVLGTSKYFWSGWINKWYTSWSHRMMPSWVKPLQSSVRNEQSIILSIIKSCGDGNVLDVDYPSSTFSRDKWYSPENTVGQVQNRLARESPALRRREMPFSIWPNSCTSHHRSHRLLWSWGKRLIWGSLTLNHRDTSDRRSLSKILPLN